DDEDDELIEEDAPDWLADMQPVDAQDQDDLAFEFVQEETEPTPADNAPDWLNAMVPGLDVDFEAEEDTPIEAEFIPESTSGFEWLNAIVETEANQPPIIHPDNLPGKSSKQEARFVFSRPPLWLRQETSYTKQEQEETFDLFAESTDDLTEDDFNFDEIGEELPPWLDYDESIIDTDSEEFNFDVDDDK
ncbi:MAG: hypothetical protein D6711_07860, partial [Chloroflexi bacterium]